MTILFVFFSIAVIVLLMKCIYENLDNPKEKEEEEKKEEEKKSPPTLEETLISILEKFQKHIQQVEVSTDAVIVYCFKKTSQDSINDFNIIKIRFCDLDFKSISKDDCQELQKNLDTHLNLIKQPQNDNK